MWLCNAVIVTLCGVVAICVHNCWTVHDSIAPTVCTVGNTDVVSILASKLHLFILSMVWKQCTNVLGSHSSPVWCVHITTFQLISTSRTWINLLYIWRNPGAGMSDSTSPRMHVELVFKWMVHPKLIYAHFVHAEYLPTWMVLFTSCTYSGTSLYFLSDT